MLFRSVYDVQAVYVHANLAFTNTIPTAAYRGAGRPVSSYAIERLVDEAALQIGMDPASVVPMVGASGAIAGVMGGYLLLFPKARIDVLIIFVIFFRIFAIPAWIVLGFWFGVQFVSTAAAASDGVAYAAHVGGFAGGLVLTLPSWLRRGGFGFWRANAGQPPHPQATYPLHKTSIPRVPRQ